MEPSRGLLSWLISAANRQIGTAILLFLDSLFRAPVRSQTKRLGMIHSINTTFGLRGARPTAIPVSPLQTRSQRAATKLAVVAAVAQDTKRRSRNINESLRVNGLQPTSPKAWEFVSAKLRESNVKIISQQEVLFAQEKGAVVLDIRPIGDYNLGYLKGSVNVSLFRLITGWDPVKTLRRAGFAFFGVFNGTEVNPDFEQQILAAISAPKGEAGKDTPIVLLCQTGGTLQPTTSYKNGKQSRSLIAAYELVKLGFTNISVLKGGFSEWKRNERPYEVAEPLEP